MGASAQTPLSQLGGPPPVTTPASPGPATPAPVPVAGPGGVSPEYRVGAGDRLRIIVFGQQDLGGEFQLDGSGVVSLPLIGQVVVKDKTVRELEMAIADRLRDGYLSDPRVSAEVLNFRPFYILGEVNRPGEYPYTDGLTVMKAVATAQGYTYRANQKRVFIKRAHETEEKAYPLQAATTVGPGDTIRIPERFF
ncbi:MAG: polysaccharide export protein [Alphaproteobacteria bacterium]|nr:polysaccharide export protein [Alphaproteobacteria bacterium]